MKEEILRLAYAHSGSGFMGMVGIIWMGFVADGFEFRERWLFVSLLILGILWLFHIPTGTMVGLALTVYTFANRKKFKGKATDSRLQQRA